MNSPHPPVVGEKPPTQAQLRRERRALLALDVRCASWPLFTVPSESHEGTRHTVNVEADTCTCSTYKQTTCWHRGAVAAWLANREQVRRAEIAALVDALGSERALACLRIHNRTARATPYDLADSPGWHAHFEEGAAS